MAKVIKIPFPPLSLKRLLYQLDSGYLFTRSNVEISHELNSHILPIVEGRLVNSIINQKKLLVRENKRLCELRTNSSLQLDYSKLSINITL